ncbi:phage tail protein I [Paracoccus sp. KR1-242]|uniref:phage tail protein I n=1 Tax=Paracoccus sp. KR1-242 TaxID=3410028 RepID=UPI003C073F05
MPVSNDIMPPHSGPAEKALVDGVVAGFDFDIRVGDVWNPQRAPAVILPWLAWALSVDDWDENWTDERKRAVIAASVNVHRHKGTVSSIRAALAAMGYGDARLIEDADLPRIGGEGLLIGGTWEIGDETWVLGPTDPSWADYWIEVQTAIPGRDAARLAERLRTVAPARCRLRTITLSGAFYTIGDGLWLIGDDIAIGNIYEVE